MSLKRLLKSYPKETDFLESHLPVIQHFRDHREGLKFLDGGYKLYAQLPLTNNRSIVASKRT